MSFNQYIADKFTKLYRFIEFVSRRLIIDGGLQQAAALSFTSLLAIVPLMSVSFAALSAFPEFKKVNQQIQDFIFTHFVPASGHTVQLYLQQFTEKASSLSTVGVLFLLVSAIAVMFTIEQALNDIWQIKQRRHGLSAFLLYWALLTLGPVLIGLILVISSYLISLPLFSGTVIGIGITKAWMLSWLPFILTVIGFTLLYIMVPNTTVPFSYGLIGAIMAAILFEFAKTSFTLYLQQFNTYELLYGAFATIPIFFIWVYFVWVVVLLGAEISYALASYYIRRQGPKLDPFTHAVIWLRDLWIAQQEGSELSLNELIDNDSYNYELAPKELILILLNSHFIRKTANGKYVLVRDLSNMSWGGLYSLLPWKIPASTDVMQYKIDELKGYCEFLELIEKNMANCMSQPLQSLLSIETTGFN